MSADYLFGKPVTNGKVRVVRENKREWNWREQKYNIDEGESHEGKADENGKFTAKFDLNEDHQELQTDDWRKFRDLNFTAYRRSQRPTDLCFDEWRKIERFGHFR